MPMLYMSLCSVSLLMYYVDESDKLKCVDFGDSDDVVLDEVLCV